MSYQNPIRILTTDQIKRLDAASLKSIKKEILLHFQLTEEPTIERNGIVLDKNQVLELFNKLEENLTLHLRIYENKDLIHLLETGNMSFFGNPIAQQEVLTDAAHRYLINGFIATKLNQETAILLEQVNAGTPKQLSAIFDYTSKMAAEQQDKSYNKAYVTLKAKVDNLPISFPDPFASQNGFLFHESITELVDLDFYNCFPFLPGAFNDIGFMYAVWCHNNVINGAFKRMNLFDKYKRGDLYTMVEAFDIAEQISTSEQFKRNGYDLRQYLRVTKRKKPEQRKEPKIDIRKKPTTTTTNNNNRNTSGANRNTTSNNNYKTSNSNNKNTTTSRRRVEEESGENPVKLIFQILMLIVVLARVVVGIGQCSQSNSRYNNRDRHRIEFPVPHTSTSDKDITILRDVSVEDLAPGNRSQRQLEEIWVGDKEEGWMPLITSSSFGDSLVELAYDVKMMPSRISELNSFIPEKVYEKYKDREMEFLLKLKDPDFPEQVFQHRFKYDLKKDGRRKQVIYDGRINKGGDKDLLIIDRMRKNEIPLKGTITRYIASSMEPLRTEHFEIKYNKVLDNLPRAEGEFGAIDDGRFEKFDGYEITSLNDPNFKNLILNNFALIHYKSLKMGNFYTLQKVASYYMYGSGVAKEEIKMARLNEVKGSLNYYSCSNEDGIALCSLNGKGFSIRYFVDRKTKQVVRMQMVVSDVSGQMQDLVDVIEVVLYKNEN